MMQQVKAICGFCGTGCGLILHVEDNQIKKVVGDKENPVSHGETCVKGARGWGYLSSQKRLTTPLIRRNGSLKPATWEEALDYIQEKFTAIKERYGSDAFGLFSCSKATNELNYIAQKFMRTIIGSNNIDSCNRS